MGMREMGLEEARDGPNRQALRMRMGEIRLGMLSFYRSLHGQVPELTHSHVLPHISCCAATNLFHGYARSALETSGIPYVGFTLPL